MLRICLGFAPSDLSVSSISEQGPDPSRDAFPESSPSTDLCRCMFVAELGLFIQDQVRLVLSNQQNYPRYAGQNGTNAVPTLASPTVPLPQLAAFPVIVATTSAPGAGPPEAPTPPPPVSLADLSTSTGHSAPVPRPSSPMAIFQEDATLAGMAISKHPAASPTHTVSGVPTTLGLPAPPSPIHPTIFSTVHSTYRVHFRDQPITFSPLPFWIPSSSEDSYLTRSDRVVPLEQDIDQT